MSPEIREIIDNDQFYLGAVRAVAELLPPDDEALDQYLAAAVSGHDQIALHFLLCAAALSGRPVSSLHLRGGLSMLNNREMTLCLIWKMHGDIPADILHAVQHTVVSEPMSALCLFAVHAWCVEHREGVFPAELVTQARLLAHANNPEAVRMAYLWGLSERLHDPQLEAVLLACSRGADLDEVRTVSSQFVTKQLGFCRAAIELFIPAERDRRISTSGPLRRAVERIGRNDPCPCGSGHKYKRCCEDKDKERLRHSSTVAGMTVAEVKAHPEEQLTSARLEKMTGHDIARLNPALVKPDIHPEYLVKLAAFKLLDEAVAAFETIGCHDEAVVDVWHFTLFWIARQQRLDLARRMLALRCQHGPADDRLMPSARLLLCSDDPPRYLEMLEHLCGEAVRTANDNFCQDLVSGLLCSPFKALGILAARSYIPLSSKKTPPSSSKKSSAPATASTSHPKNPSPKSSKNASTTPFTKPVPKPPPFKRHAASSPKRPPRSSTATKSSPSSSATSASTKSASPPPPPAPPKPTPNKRPSAPSGTNSPPRTPPSAPPTKSAPSSAVRPWKPSARPRPNAPNGPPPPLPAATTKAPTTTPPSPSPAASTATSSPVPSTFPAVFTTPSRISPPRSVAPPSSSSAASPPGKAPPSTASSASVPPRTSSASASAGITASSSASTPTASNSSISSTAVTSTAALKNSDTTHLHP